MWDTQEKAAVAAMTQAMQRIEKKTDELIRIQMREDPQRETQVERLNYPTQTCPLCRQKLVFKPLYLDQNTAIQIRVCGCKTP